MNVPLIILIYGGGGFICFLGILFLSLTLYIAYIHWKYSHIPSPKMPSFYAGHLPDMWRLSKEVCEEVSLPTVVDYWSQKVESSTFVIFFFSTATLCTMDPTVIKDIVMNTKNDKTKRLVDNSSTVFGIRFTPNGLFSIKNYDSWKVRRKLYDPAFNKAYLKTLVGTFNEITNSTLDEMKPLADGRTVLPLKKYISKLTADIISKVAFGTDFSKTWTANNLDIQVPDGDNVDVFAYLRSVSMKALEFGFFSMFPSLNQYIHPIEGRKYRKCLTALRKIGRDCIMRRIKMIQDGGEIPQDILTFMLSNTNESVEIEDLVDDFLTFYVAGQETTAIALMFSIILLWQHPNALERVQEEIRQVLGDRKYVSDTDLEDLQFTEQVLYETLRLYPPAFGISKCLHSTLTTDSCSIPAGTDVLIMGANMFRKSEHFDDPDAFKPERFHLDNKKPSSFAYFPFGLGHRSCIGKHFAIMEVKISLARLLQTFTVRFPDDYQVQVIQRCTQQPKDDLLCTMTSN